ncbi:MAG TPA: hypothetical protein VJ750_12540 [Rhizomicrobium sp.]|nr:hypothetical protein [Rhizomicrobium sp.]
MEICDRKFFAPLTISRTFDTEYAIIEAVIVVGCLMSTDLSPRAVLLGYSFVVVSLICEAIIYCAQLFRA